MSPDRNRHFPGVCRNLRGAGDAAGAPGRYPAFFIGRPQHTFCTGAVFPHF